MIVQIEGNAALLFTYDSLFDTGSTGGDYWFESVADAVDCVNEEYGTSATTWFATEDQPEHCQQDWITPARVPGRETGNPIFGSLQLMIGNAWVDLGDASKEIEIDYNSMAKLNTPPTNA